MIDPINPDYSNTPVSKRRPHFEFRPLDPLADPVVSIVTPFYNTGEIFHETALSVLKQSLQQWEWLIINDGSTDSCSLDILRNYRNVDPRVKVIDHPQNLGLSAARNTGFRESHTEYIVLLDSDDLLETTAVEKWFWFLKTHPEWSFVGGYSIGFGARQYTWHNGFHDNENNLEQNLIDHTCMVKRDTFFHTEGFDESIRGGLEDWDYWIRCAANGFWGTTIPEYLHWYRTRATHTDKWENLNDARMIEFKKSFQEKYPQLWVGSFPHIIPQYHPINEPIIDNLPCENKLKKEKNRILLIIPWLSIGGSDKFNIELINQLTSRDWEVTVVTTAKSDNVWFNYFSRITPDIHVLDNFLDIGDFPRYIKYLTISRSIDVILISNSQIGYLILPFLRSCFPNLAICDYNHAVTLEWKNGGYPRFASLYSKFLNYHLVSSDDLKSWMVQQGVDQEKIEVCYINIDSSSWKPNPLIRKKIRDRLHLSDEIPIILYVARLDPAKQPDVFVKTIFDLSQKNYPLISYVIGDGSMLSWLNKFISDHHMQNFVSTLGALPNEQVREWMLAGDIVFLPSKSEGISLSFYEAMACGLAVVGSDVGGQHELVTPECGFLLPLADLETEIRKYSTALEKLIIDTRLRKEMGIHSRERIVNKFDINFMGDRVNSLLQNMIKSCQHSNSSILSYDIGLLFAQQAVDNTRLERFSDGLWFNLSKYQQTIEQLEKQAKINFYEIPPASTMTYLYFAIRQAFYKPFLWINRQRFINVVKIKDYIKKRLIEN